MNSSASNATKNNHRPRVDQLRSLLGGNQLIVVPCCYDALTARLIEQAGFDMTFVSGFAASAARIAMPDLGLMSYGEVVNHVRDIAEATSLPFVADGDTGYGNSMNIIRTVKGLARAGAAAVMIEDQVAPKRCGHTPGKAVVEPEIAFDRIRAATDAREEEDVLILARTDARYEHGLSEAIRRAVKFHELGADILFVEAPQSEAEMREICQEVPGPNLANMLEGGQTPVLPQAVLQEIGFALAAYPLTLLAAAMKSLIQTLDALKADIVDGETLIPFTELRHRLGFDDYHARATKYLA